jgi:hypothetical protein
MKRALLIAAMSLMISPPAFSQSAHEGDARDSYARMDHMDHDHDADDILRAIQESGRGGMRRGGAGFFMRNGDNVVAVRCDPQDSMRACVDATLTLLERVKSAQSSGAASTGAAGGQPPPR